MWRFKASISANKNPRNLQRCIKVSLHQRSWSTKNRSIPIHKNGIWTYTITICTRRHSSTSVAELYQQTWRISEMNNGRSLCRWFNYWRRQNNRWANSKRHSYINIQRSRVCLTQVTLKFSWARRKQFRTKFNWTKPSETTTGCQIWQVRQKERQT